MTPPSQHRSPQARQPEMLRQNNRQLEVAIAPNAQQSLRQNGFYSHGARKGRATCIPLPMKALESLQPTYTKKTLPHLTEAASGSVTRVRSMMRQPPRRQPRPASGQITQIAPACCNTAEWWIAPTTADCFHSRSVRAALMWSMHIFACYDIQSQWFGHR